MTRRARVAGAGLAGLTCAHLLSERGWDVDCWDMRADQMPPLVLSDLTAQLVRDLWQGGDELFDHSVRVRARIVRWGDGPPETVPHAAVVVDSHALGTRLLDHLALHRRVSVVEVGDAALADRLADQRAVITFDATGRGARAAAVLGPARRRSFGRRCALAAAVTMAEPRCVDSIEALLPSSCWGPRAPGACWMESTADGWVFLAPTRGDGGVLQAMVPLAPSDPEETLRQVCDGLS